MKIIRIVTTMIAIFWLAPIYASVEFSQLTAKDFHLGTNTYLVYMINDETKEIRSSELWQRTTAIEEKQGEQFVKISQQWRSMDTKANRQLESINRLDDFAPVSHWRKTAKGVEAFTYDGQGIHGVKSIKESTNQNFELTTRELPLNWELDMETFQLLEFSDGKEFRINFYHPGSKSGPKEYVYQVIGSDTLSLAGMPVMECWQLKIDYGKGSYATFWIDKASKQTVKMEEKWRQFTRYKYLLPV